MTRADLVVHVADAAAGEMEAQIEAVRTVLAEIGAGQIEEVLALNKIDLVSELDRERLLRRFPGTVAISALTGEGLEALLERAGEAIPRFPMLVTVLLPHDRGDLVAMLHREAEVLGQEPGEAGTIVRARVGERSFAQIRDHVLPRGRSALSG